jgi:hypothetical protein
VAPARRLEEVGADLLPRGSVGEALIGGRSPTIRRAARRRVAERDVQDFPKGSKDGPADVPRLLLHRVHVEAVAGAPDLRSRGPLATGRSGQHHTATRTKRRGPACCDGHNRRRINGNCCSSSIVAGHIRICKCNGVSTWSTGGWCNCTGSTTYS